jgi:putative ABC transport system substrate-binding protein
MKTPRTLEKLVILLLTILILSLSACTDQPATRVSDATPTPEVETQPPAGDPGSVEIPEFEWFQPSEQMAANWAISLDPDNPSLISFLPKYQVEAADEPSTSKVLFLYTKTHPDFDISVGQVLSTLVDQGLMIEAAIFLAADELAGFDALIYAEANDFDLIFTVGSSTTAFLHENYQGGKISVVSLLSKDPVLLGQMPDYENGSGSNIAYTSVGIPVELQMSYFQELVPNLKNIAILYAQGNVSAVLTQVDPLDIYAKESGINLIHVPILNRDDPDETRREIEEKLPQAIEALFQNDPEMHESILLVTASGSITKQFETVNALAGGVPVVSLFPDLVREGDVSAVLSAGVSFGSNSILAALYGAKVLQGEAQPGELPVGVITPPDIAISFAKAREIGLQVPFYIFESATFVYDPDGVLVRDKGQAISQP